MKKSLIIISVLICLIFTSCANQKDEICKTLDSINISDEYTAFLVMVPNLSEPSLFTEQYPNEYKEVSAFGKEGVPYILDYVEENNLNTLNVAFFICCCYGILELDSWLTNEPLSDIDSHIIALRGYI